MVFRIWFFQASLNDKAIMNSTKYAVRFYNVYTLDGQQHLELAREVQVHWLINAAILLAGPASLLTSEAKPQIAKFIICERGEYRKVQPSDWVAEVHDIAKMGEIGLP